MDSIPLVRRAAFQQCTLAMAELGKDPDRELSRAGIGLWHHGAPDDWVPLEAFLDTMGTCAAKLGDPRFGITVAEMNPMRFGEIGQTITRSVSLYSGLRASARLVNKLNTSASIWLANSPDTIWFCRSPTHNNLLEQFVLGHMIALVQMAAADSWAPQEVRLTTTNDPSLNHISVLDNSVIRTGQTCLAVAVPKSLLADRIYAGLQGNKKPSPECGPHMPAPPQDFVGSLREIVESALMFRYPTIDNVCEIIDVPKRTLQRELARDGLTYKAIVTQVRYLKACKLLAETEMSILEIANALSYARDVHFIRAFRHWAGITPGEFRHYGARSSTDLG